MNIPSTYVIPAQAGIHILQGFGSHEIAAMSTRRNVAMDSRLRGNDGRGA